MSIQILKYEIIIYWSKEDDCFILEVPELSGCKADGKTCREALQNAETISLKNIPSFFCGFTHFC